MKALRIVRLAVVLALGLAFLTNISPAAACVLASESDSVCGSWQVRLAQPKPPLRDVVALAKPVAIAYAPQGGSPNDGLAPNDTWLRLDANSSIWYKIDNGDNFYLDLWLDAYGKSGVTLSVFSPEQANGLSVDTMPKGRGAPSKSDLSHDIFWSGAQARGTWYALVKNYNPFPVDYKLGNKQWTEVRNCRSYPEYINGVFVPSWTACR